jgi:transglutaminase-like putative cysteine protease
MRLDIRYVTRFRYAGAVTESQNELRACPATDELQALVHYHVTTQPSSRVGGYLDYWGTRVDTFGIRAPHRTLEVVAEATVETAGRPTDCGPLVVGPGGVVALADREPVPLTAVSDPRFVDRHLEFLRRSPHVDWGEEVAAAARGCRAAVADDAGALVLALHERVAGLEYRAGETYVGVGVDAVFTSGSGVCQDFAHLLVAMCRAVGLPARYVSGYLFTTDDAAGRDADHDVVEVETHAWVEVALPPRGWLALDPTNRQVVGERHVAIGRGRDYEDVAPLRGVFSGQAEHDLEVNVTIRRLARDPLAGLPGGSRRWDGGRGPGRQALLLQQPMQQSQ